MKETAL